MSFLKPPEIKAPPVPDPEPVVISDEVSDEIRQEEARRRRARRGAAKTVITGELVPPTVGKTALG